MMKQLSAAATEQTPEARHVNRHTRVWLFLILYLFGFLLLAWRLWNRPDFAYNWESYTLRGLIDFVEAPTWDVFRLNDGLMTDSGRSAASVGPAWAGFQVLGHTWLGMRLPIVAIAALSVPLTWLLGRKLYSDQIGISAALLVATSQVFLLYGRTATLVGMSLTPALIGFLLLWQTIRPGDRRWFIWLALLQVSLVANSYFYSPIRFLWLIALVLFVVEFAIRGGERRKFAIAIGVTSVVLPIAILFLRPGPIVSVDTAIRLYYNGRGEQIFRINDSRAGYLVFLRPESEEERAELEEASGNELAFRLVRKNAVDLANLLLDRETQPAITDYWNPHGRLHSRLLVPLFLAGLLMLSWRFLGDPRARLLQALLWGFSLPLLLTSQVHIGRLIYIIPILALVASVPIQPISAWLERRQPEAFRPAVRTWGALLVALLVVLLGAIPSLEDWRVEFPESRMVRVQERIEDLTRTPPTTQLVYVFGDEGAYEIEGLRIAELEVLMAGYLRFEDLRTGETRGSGPIPLIYGSIVPRLAEPGAIPGYCTNLYLVEPEQVEHFLAVTQSTAQQACGRALFYNELDV